jgi:hypothetical protein
MNIVNAENKKCFTYITDELLIELLGGVRIEILDTMKRRTMNSKNYYL